MNGIRPRDERLSEIPDGSALRAFAELDGLEPSSALDRAVLRQARRAVSRGGTTLRWRVPASVAAATAVACVAVGLHRSASRPVAPSSVPPSMSSRPAAPLSVSPRFIEASELALPVVAVQRQKQEWTSLHPPYPRAPIQGLTLPVVVSAPPPRDAPEKQPGPVRRPAPADPLVRPASR